MGEEESKVQERRLPDQQLAGRLVQNYSDHRLRLSHQSNIYELVTYLEEHYYEWQISQIHLDNDMIAGEVVEIVSRINFEKGLVPLKVLSLSHNDIVCDNLKYFRGAFLNYLMMLYLGQIAGQLDHNQIASDGCYYISKTKLARLQTLDLSHNLINDYGAGHLATSNLPSLVNLIVSNNKMSFKGVSYFGKAHWPSLAFVQVKENDFEPTKEMETLEFRTQVKMFRLQLQ